MNAQLIRLSDPTGLAVSLEDMKAALRIDSSDDDTLLTSLIKQETRRYEDYTGRLMLPISAEYQTDCWGWGGRLVIPYGPVRSVTSVSYLDTDHVEQTLPSSEWFTVSKEDGEEIWWTDTFSAPSISDRPLAVRVLLNLGYDEPGVSGSGDDPELFPVVQDQGVITAMVQWRFDRDEAMPDDLLRRMAHNRRIYR